MTGTKARKDNDATLETSKANTKHQLKDREHCFKNPGGVGRDAGKLNRDLDGSAVFRPTKMANTDFEKQTLPGRGNTMRQNNETVEEPHVGILRTQSDVFLAVACLRPK